MPKYMIQVLGTYLECVGETVEELRINGMKLKNKHNLSGMTYRIFKDYKFVKDCVFS